MLDSSQLRILIFLLVGGESGNEDNDNKDIDLDDDDGDDAAADDDVDCEDE